MARNTFATIGILAVLLLSLGMVSALEIADLSNHTSAVAYTATSQDISIVLTNTTVTTGTANLSYQITSGTATVTFLPANPVLVNGTNTTIATVAFTAGQTGAISGIITADPSAVNNY